MREKDLFKYYSIREIMYELKKLRIVELHNGSSYLTEISKRGAVPLSRETGFSPQKEEHDTKVVLPESRYDLPVLPPSLEFVAAICVLALAEEGLCAKLDAGERN